MTQYIIRRLFLFVPVLLGVSVLIFVLMRVVPGDVALMVLVGPGGEASVDPQLYQQVRSKLHLDRPLFVDFTNPARGSQYGEWVWGLIQGDWGKSLRNDTPVLKEILLRFPLTFEIATLTAIIAVLIAIPLGIIMAARPDGWIDYIARVVSIGGLAMPSFWVAALMLLFMVIWFKTMPPLGYTHIWDQPWTNISQVIWASLALGYFKASIVARMTRSALLEELGQDYIRTALSKGLRERVVLFRHALRNAMLPVVTLVGAQYAALMSGTVIMEALWNLPGLGNSLIDSIKFRDYPMVQGLVMVFAFIVIVANLLVDLVYAWLDPRVRYR